MFIKSAFHFNRNLINKTNKQAKYNQRHWNWEWADSDQRGEGKRLKGKGWKVCRNNYKGTWTITRGCEIWEGGGESWDRVECWGEKVGNSTWTTIKNWLKKNNTALNNLFMFFGIPMHSFLLDMPLTKELLSYTAYLCSYCTNSSIFEIITNF